MTKTESEQQADQGNCKRKEQSKQPNNNASKAN